MTRPGSALLALLGVLVLAPRASADSEDDVRRIAKRIDALQSEASGLERTHLRVRSRRSAEYVIDRLTEGELFLRLHDYVRASIIFLDIVDNYQNSRSYADALFLLGESLFLAGDNFGAKSRFAEVLDHSNDPAFRQYVQRALGRLIEIAIRTRAFEGVEEYFARINQIPPAELESSTSYVRAKFLYFRGDLDPARQAFEAVSRESPYYPHARYFIGVILTRSQQYPQAIEAFRRVIRLDAQSDEQKKVVDLARLGLGRLYYETDNLDRSIEAYQGVSRHSVFFDAMLYEAAWVLIRSGDSTGAERTLETLTISNPESRYIPDAKILRGNLLLRDGRFPAALEVFQGVVRQFGPVKRQLERMIAEHNDPNQYFEELVRSNLDVFDVGSFMPPLAVRWAREEEDISRALGALGDLSLCRSYVTESERLIGRLEAALQPQNRVNIFPELRAGRERALAIQNQMTRFRARLMAIEEAEFGGGGGELGELRARRRGLERQLRGLPVADGDFEARDETVLGRYRRMGRELARNSQRVDHLQATIVAMEKFLRDSPELRRQSGAEALLEELRLQTSAIQTYRNEIAEIRNRLEDGRVQIGLSDARYRRDADVRNEIRDLVNQEAQLVGRRGPMGAKIERLLRQMDSVDQSVEVFLQRLDVAAEARARDVQHDVDEERARVAGFREQLTRLEAEAQDVIGHVTYENFRAVKQRFYDLVLRADVGIIDVAWSSREEHRIRVENLTSERQRELQTLDDEFREVLGESREGEGAGAGQEGQGQ
ncbi:MAG: tetratricopeptide repeat protein [Deltaproteobacteria bacterium]|nr:tetratricopeptide repeat protein [Deltaproteobacteria bacterium]